MGKFIFAVLFAAVLNAAAHAQTPSQAQLLQRWVCPAGTCDTKCVGPGGALNIAAHEVKVFQFAVHPRRLWLDADGKIYVLGDDDHCQFGGAVPNGISYVTPPQVPGTPLNPPRPPCVCIGNQCNPPGCAPTR